MWGLVNIPVPVFDFARTDVLQSNRLSLESRLNVVWTDMALLYSVGLHL